MPPISEILIFNEIITDGKDNFNTLIDIDFLQSKSRVLRLWDIDYESLLNIFEKSMLDLKTRLENIEITWYNNHKHYMRFNDTSDLKVFLDEKNMVIYKLLYVPIDGTKVFELVKLIYNTSQNSNNKLLVVKLKFDINNSNTFNEEEIFLDKMIQEYFPEYTL